MEKEKKFAAKMCIKQIGYLLSQEIFVHDRLKKLPQKLTKRTDFLRKIKQLTVLKRKNKSRQFYGLKLLF